MSVTVTWGPNPPADNIVSYTLNSAPTSTGTWTLVFSVPATKSGPYWDPVNNLYTYTDAAGTIATWYQLIAVAIVDSVPVSSAPSAPFQPISSSPSESGQVSVNQDYGTPGALRYQTASGCPIEGATVLLFTLANFQTGNTSQAIAATLTDQYGNWINPVFLTTGQTYVVLFSKSGLYGPDSTQIVV
jgi:hypothetical protein